MLCSLPREECTRRGEAPPCSDGLWTGSLLKLPGGGVSSLQPWSHTLRRRETSRGRKYRLLLPLFSPPLYRDGLPSLLLRYPNDAP